MLSDPTLAWISTGDIKLDNYIEMFSVRQHRERASAVTFSTFNPAEAEEAMNMCSQDTL